MKKFFLHYSGLKVARDGEVLVPQSGVHKECYTYGCITYKGYRRVYYQGKEYKVHKLVAEVFLNGNKPIDGKKYAVHHKNENHSDNRVDNLLIISHSEHTALHNKDKKTNKPVIGTNLKTGETIEFQSLTEAARVLDINKGNISSCLTGRYKSTGGFKWYNA